ncbi:MAG: glycosyltransferase family 4 protein [Pseudomonadota bacterium]
MEIVHYSLAKHYRGGERQLELLVRHLADSGTRQRVVCRCIDLERRLARIPGVDVRYAGNPLTAALNGRGAALGHAHDGRSVQSAWLARRLWGRPYIVTRRIIKSPGRSWLTRSAYTGAALVVCVSQAVRATMNAYDERIATAVIHDGVDPQTLASAETRQSVHDDSGEQFLVLHVGELSDREKGQRDILAVAGSLAGDYPSIRFVLAGRGPDEATFRAEAARLGNVRLVGFASHPAVWYGAADAFVFPSRTEGLGGALLEAMANGLPVLAARTGGIPEVVSDGRDGLLFGSGDTAALATALVRLYRDDALRRRLAAAARTRAADFGAAAMGDGYALLYKGLAPAGRGQNRQETPAAGNTGSQCSSARSSTRWP